MIYYKHVAVLENLQRHCFCLLPVVHYMVKYSNHSAGHNWVTVVQENSYLVSLSKSSNLCAKRTTSYTQNGTTLHHVVTQTFPLHPKTDTWHQMLSMGTSPTGGSLEYRSTFYTCPVGSWAELNDTHTPAATPTFAVPLSWTDSMWQV